MDNNFLYIRVLLYSMAQKYNIGDVVKFKDKDDDYTYIGEIIDYYKHNKLYIIDIQKALDNLDDSLPDSGSSYEETI